MKISTALCSTALLLALPVTGAAIADDANRPSYDELAKRLMSVESEVVELRKQVGNDNWLTESRADEVRAIVHDVLADADTRASLLSSGMSAGYDDGFVIGDAAGNFSLRINGQMQVRYMYNHRRTDSGSISYHPGFGGYSIYQGNATDTWQDLWPLPNWTEGSESADRHRGGFEMPRTKLWFTGHVINPNWQYHFEIDFGAYSRGEFSTWWDTLTMPGVGTLRDAWIAYQYPDTGLTFTVGQFKLPFMREQLIDSRYQQAAERSLVHQYWSTGRSAGIQIGWEGEMFRAWGAISNGAHSDNNNLHVWFRNSEFSLTGRGEVLFAGNWDQFNEFRSPPGEEFGVLLGAALHWEDGEYGTSGGLQNRETELFWFTVDAMAKFGGWNLYGAYVFSYTDTNTRGNFTNHSLMFQGGYHVTQDWELFGRYEHVFWDSDLKSDYSMKDLSVMTVGVNHYMFGNAGHSAKWTTDFGFSFNRVAIGSPITGWTGESPDASNGQFVFRTQLQLAF